jgi:hypothetical protein
MGSPATAGQIAAWKASFVALQSATAELLQVRPTAAQWGIVFEYELPRERGRRPDVVILTGSHAAVLEFKRETVALQAHVDQVAAYARDLQHYHAGSHRLIVEPFLVLGDNAQPMQAEGVRVLADTHLTAELTSLSGLEGPLDVLAWVQADYQPLPSLVKAARRIFRHEPLPRLRRAESAGVSAAVARLVEIAQEAQQRGGRHLVLLTGVPGSGKTLVGLQFVHQLVGAKAEDHGVFLSGNAPLVEVLQATLRDRVFVQHVHGFLKQYGGGRTGLPIEHVWIFDEAQRAWDALRVFQKRGGDYSEPEEFLRLGERMPGWALLVGLVGTGQEIHLGEEAGIVQWDWALSRLTEPWIIHCPPSLGDEFASVSGSRLRVNGALSLDETLRSHLASGVDRWVGAVLSGDLSTAKGLASTIRYQRFDIYITRDLDAAREYVRERYAGDEESRYGLLASSRARHLVRHGLPEGFTFNRSLRPATWFNDPPESRHSCCQLRDPVTEFQCQGLELEMPIVCWGNDLIWRSGTWDSAPTRSGADNPHRLRINSYRVLLTRGRDGMVIFVPNEAAMNGTYMALVEAGAAPLSRYVTSPAS